MTDRVADVSMESLRKFVAPEFVFGWGARRLAAQYVTNLGSQKVLVVSDPGVDKAGWTGGITKALESEGIPYVKFADVTPNPKDHEVMAGARVYREHGCDGIVAVGGGSPMDCAKGIGIVSSNEGHILDYEGVDLIGAPCPPFVFIPTTAGTSADVSQFCIIADTQRQLKVAILSKAVVPDVSLVDPETTTTMDQYLTACTGIDAFVHAAEALVSNANSSITDLHALEAIRLISGSLVAAIERPAGVECRTAMMLASLHAGLAFSNASLGAVHAMAHSLGGLKDLPHGECNALLLPHVIGFNYAKAESQYSRMGRAMGLNLDSASAEGRREAIVSAVTSLIHRSGIDRTLASLGVTKDELPSLAAKAANDPCMVTNPCEAGAPELESVYARAF